MRKLLVKSFFVSLILGLAGYAYWSWPDVTLLKRKNPSTTALMELRDAEYRQKGLKPTREHVWVPYRAISDHLKEAIIISEDASFYSHKGIDYFELKEAAREDWEKGKFKRGGSTITMQLARNLYLNPSKNPLRKLQEIIIAWQLEQSLSKTRIFELYLNVIEWGPGFYGAEAASRHYFSKSASDLDQLQAATLAALVPNPRYPRGRGLLYRRNLILARMASIGYISEGEFDIAKRSPLFYKGDEHLNAPDRSDGRDELLEMPAPSDPSPDLPSPSLDIH